MGIVVRISNDNMEAAVEVDGQPGEEVDAGAILRALGVAGVVSGIDQNACRQAGTPGIHIVARGSLPVHGEDGRIEMAVEFHRSKIGLARHSGSIDFHERGSFTPIEKGQLIARITPPTAGLPGRTVRGIEIPATPGKRAHLAAGKNTKLAADGQELRATIAGDLRISGDSGERVEVMDMIRVPGNVDFDFGSIECEGPVRVEGDLLPGFHIRAGGDVWIGGVVEGGEVTSRGNVTIMQGVLGHSRIQASGSITVTYAREAYLEAGGTITIARESINSTVVAGNNISMPMEGRVVGGSLRARNNIEVGAASFAQGAPTLLAAGVNPLEELQAARLKTALHRADSLEKRIGRFKDLAGPDGPHEMLDQILERAAQKREGSEGQLASLPKDDAAPAECRIQIKREIHPGVRIRIGARELTVRNDTQAATYYRDAESGQVVQI